MEVAIIDYGAGNIQSLQFALNRLGVQGILTADVNVLQSADKVIFPGVGEASSAMQKLNGLWVAAFTSNINATCTGDLFRNAAHVQFYRRRNDPRLGVFLT